MRFLIIITKILLWKLGPSIPPLPWHCQWLYIRLHNQQSCTTTLKTFVHSLQLAVFICCSGLTLPVWATCEWSQLLPSYHCELTSWVFLLFKFLLINRYRKLPPFWILVSCNKTSSTHFWSDGQHLSSVPEWEGKPNIGLGWWHPVSC